MKPIFSGLMTALVTPFHDDFSLDLESLKKIISLQKKNGVDGIVINGTTGESPSLKLDEVEKCLEVALQFQEENFKIYVGTGTNNLGNTLEKTTYFSNKKFNENKKIDGVMIVCPYYNKPNQRHLENYFYEICSAIKSTPVCIYNVPGRTGIHLLPETFAKIAKKNENVVAIKEACGDVLSYPQHQIQWKQMGLTHLRLLTGNDAELLPCLVYGGSGVISVTSHIIAPTLKKIIENYKNKEMEEALDLSLRTHVVNQGVFKEPNPVGIKYLLSLLGQCKPVLRSPLYEINESESLHFKNILKELEKNNIDVLNSK